jgi:hypothetical protein
LTYSPQNNPVKSGVVEVIDYASLVDAISKFAGTKEIRMIKPIALEDQLLIDTKDNFVLTGLGRYTTLTLKAGSAVLGKTAIQVTDSNDIILDKFGLNCAGQTAGHGINMLRSRRSAIGPTFLRIDNTFADGIHNNGSGAYPNSNVCNVFGNIFIYTSGNIGFYEGGYAGDDAIIRAYVQESVADGVYIGGTHMQAHNLHIHEALNCLNIASLANWFGHVNVEGAQRDGVRLTGAAMPSLQAMANHFDEIYAFDNNKSAGAYSDVRCAGESCQANSIDFLKTVGFNRSKYGYDDGAAGNGTNNHIHVHLYETDVTLQHVTAASRLGAGSVIDHSIGIDTV